MRGGDQCTNWFFPLVTTFSYVEYPFAYLICHAYPPTPRSQR